LAAQQLRVGTPICPLRDVENYDGLVVAWPVVWLVNGEHFICISLAYVPIVVETVCGRPAVPYGGDGLCISVGCCCRKAGSVLEDMRKRTGSCPSRVAW